MYSSDEDLMLKYSKGEEHAFEMLYRRYEKPVFSFIYRIVMNAVDAEDLCQETFFRVAREKKRYHASGKFKTWLFRIALNLCRDRLRRKKFRSYLSLNKQASSKNYEENELQNAISNPGPDPVEKSEKDEMKLLVQKAFTKLSEKQRTVVILKEYQELKFSEIAEILKCPIGTVKSLNHRGHANLKRILSKYID
jgi:RNA polymerase sigma-70 factor (ECF subfamily)